ncbi:MAG TPA: hypothetical protein VK175_16780 [Leadbetterella sp.]|nr:hypothetical protein [Leadbetterella sp.]
MNIFDSQSFQLIGVTIISSAIGIFVKYVSRNDQHGSFKKEDLAIGIELCITSLIMLITSSVNNYNKLNKKDTDIATIEYLKNSLHTTPWLILLAMILLWATSTVIRKKGWDNPDSLNKKWGILFPNIVGIILLLAVFTWIKN